MLAYMHYLLQYKVFFYIFLTMHLIIFISVFNQLDAQNFVSQ